MKRERFTGPLRDGPFDEKYLRLPVREWPYSMVDIALEFSQRANLFQRSRSLSPVPSAASGMSGNATVLRIDAEDTSVHAGLGGKH